MKNFFDALWWYWCNCWNYFEQRQSSCHFIFSSQFSTIIHVKLFIKLFKYSQNVRRCTEKITIHPPETASLVPPQKISHRSLFFRTDFFLRAICFIQIFFFKQIFFFICLKWNLQYTQKMKFNKFYSHE